MVPASIRSCHRSEHSEPLDTRSDAIFRSGAQVVKHRHAFDCRAHGPQHEIQAMTQTEGARPVIVEQGATEERMFPLECVVLMRIVAEL